MLKSSIVVDGAYYGNGPHIKPIHCIFTIICIHMHHAFIQHHGKYTNNQIHRKWRYTWCVVIHLKSDWNQSFHFPYVRLCHYYRCLHDNSIIIYHQPASSITQPSSLLQSDAYVRWCLFFARARDNYIFIIITDITKERFGNHHVWCIDSHWGDVIKSLPSMQTFSIHILLIYRPPRKIDGKKNALT